MAAAVCIAAGTALAAWIVVARGWDAWLPPELVLAVIAPYLVYSDWTCQLLPNRVLAPAYALVAGWLLLVGLTHGPTRPMSRALLVGAVVLAVALAVSACGAGLGGGDAKLLGLIALALGADGWIVPARAIFTGFVLAVGALCVATIVFIMRKRPRPCGIPLGPFLLWGHCWS
ncbi:prepilin peptidase [Streptomycetaceae bacterium NBC_01309]